jgi:Tol biopolymer transport system component
MNTLSNDKTMDMLESRIANILHQQASHIHFTPTTHAQVMKRITRHSEHRLLSRPVFAFTTVAVLALVVLFVFIQVFYQFYHQPVAVTPVHFGLMTTLDTPNALAQGGHLASLDPTGQHLVYQSAQGTGVMYTADVHNPNASNVLAMRDALAASWSPDGSDLVATIEPTDTNTPFLALIHTGSYMHPLGHTAIAASWSPTSANQIIYVTQENGVTQLYSTTPQQNQSAHLLATLPIAATIQQLVWSPDGHMLAIVATSNTSSTQSLHTLYLLNMQTYTIKELATSGNFTPGTLAWSPNSRYLSYAHIDTQGKTSIQTVNVATQQIAFTLKLQGTLDGLSWSPSSNALLYSDNGKLIAYVLHGAPITFTKSANEQISPFWLPDGRILCLNLVQGTQTLSILAIQHTP